MNQRIEKLFNNIEEEIQNKIFEYKSSKSFHQLCTILHHYKQTIFIEYPNLNRNNIDEYTNSLKKILINNDNLSRFDARNKLSNLFWETIPSEPPYYTLPFGSKKFDDKTVLLFDHDPIPVKLGKKIAISRMNMHLQLIKIFYKSDNICRLEWDKYQYKNDHFIKSKTFWFIFICTAVLLGIVIILLWNAVITIPSIPIPVNE
ncbi:hypothetical protein NEOKW01_1017 [Nematocida sp. AWRm80]|nr:hypothetical protein NEOKW01_1017 [Nematocida sp. AWRm80]